MELSEDGTVAIGRHCVGAEFGGIESLVLSTPGAEDTRETEVKEAADVGKVCDSAVVEGNDDVQKSLASTSKVPDDSNRLPESVIPSEVPGDSDRSLGAASSHSKKESEIRTSQNREVDTALSQARKRTRHMHELARYQSLKEQEIIPPGHWTAVAQTLRRLHCVGRCWSEPGRDIMNWTCLGQRVPKDDEYGFHCEDDHDSDISFTNDTDEELVEMEEEDWIEYMKEAQMKS